MTRQITIQEANKIVEDTRERWVSLGRSPDTLYMYDNHIKGVAQVARTVAEKLGDINPDQAYVSGLLHDIAKIDESPESMMGRFHGIMGYELLKDKSPAAARAALLHELPWNKVSQYENKFLGNKNDYEFTLNYVENNPLKDEDLLIQLADAMANKDGIVTLEQRLAAFQNRQGYEATLRKDTKVPIEYVRPYLDIKEYFDKKIGMNIYDLFF